MTPNTTYNIRAYATNNVGTAYGSNLSFTTSSVQVQIPTITTTAATSITTTSALTGGNISSDGGAAVTAKGVCWSTTANPTITSNKTTDGTGIGVFSSSIAGLTPNTTYNIRAYATNSAGTAYGSNLSFTTNSVQAQIPTITTTAANSITTTSAKSGGNISSDGGAALTAKGVCWSTTANPTISNNKTTDGTGIGSFSSSISGLTPNTTYNIRAYATNSIGTAYGSNLSFTTGSVQIPTITTTAATSITTTSATTGGNISSDGGAAVTAKGVCWSTSQNPTTSNSKTLDGTGTGSFTSSISGLAPNTTYYVRSFATNSSGTAYGNQIAFQTILSSQTTISFNSYNSSPQNSSVISINDWHYVVLTKASDRTGKLYVDGGLVITDQYSTNAFSWSTLYLGASLFTSFSDFFKGWLDEIRISNIVRSSSEIMTSFQLNSPFSKDANTIALWHFDESSGSNYVNQVSGTSSGQKFGNSIFTTGKFGNSIYFDGINSYSNCNFDLPENNVTIEFWIKIDGQQKSTVIQPYGMYSGNISIGH